MCVSFESSQPNTSIYYCLLRCICADLIVSPIAICQFQCIRLFIILRLWKRTNKQTNKQTCNSIEDICKSFPMKWLLEYLKLYTKTSIWIAQYVVIHLGERKLWAVFYVAHLMTTIQYLLDAAHFCIIYTNDI